MRSWMSEFKVTLQSLIGLPDSVDVFPTTTLDVDTKIDNNNINDVLSDIFSSLSLKNVSWRSWTITWGSMNFLFID